MIMVPPLVPPRAHTRTSPHPPAYAVAETQSNLDFAVTVIKDALDAVLEASRMYQAVVEVSTCCEILCSLNTVFRTAQHQTLACELALMVRRKLTAVFQVLKVTPLIGICSMNAAFGTVSGSHEMRKFVILGPCVSLARYLSLLNHKMVWLRLVCQGMGLCLPAEPIKGPELRLEASDSG